MVKVLLTKKGKKVIHVCFPNMDRAKEYVVNMTNYIKKAKTVLKFDAVSIEGEI